MGAADLSERQPRGELAVMGSLIITLIGSLAVEVDLINEDKQISYTPGAGMFECKSLLNRWVYLEVLSIEICQVICVPLNKFRGAYGARRQADVVKQERYGFFLLVHFLVAVFIITHARVDWAFVPSVFR